MPVVLSRIILLSGCNKQQREVQAKDSIVKADGLTLNTDDEFQTAYKKDILNQDNETSVGQGFLSHGFSWRTFLGLPQAGISTAKYKDFDKASADGYADINAVVPNMGYHLMKSAIVDATFEISKPGILVYNKKLDGSFDLVAVEYAVLLV